MVPINTGSKGRATQLAGTRKPLPHACSHAPVAGTGRHWHVFCVRAARVAVTLPHTGVPRYEVTKTRYSRKLTEELALGGVSAVLLVRWCLAMRVETSHQHRGGGCCFCFCGPACMFDGNCNTAVIPTNISLSLAHQ